MLTSIIYSINGYINSIIIRIELWVTARVIIVLTNISYYSISITLHGIIMIFYCISTIFKWYLSSINPTIDIKKAVDNIKLKLLLKSSNNIIAHDKIKLIAIPPVYAVALEWIFLLLGISNKLNL